MALVNPRAGAGRSGRRFRAALGSLRDAGVPLRVETPPHRDALRRAALEGLENGEDLVAVGGDGTVFDVLEATLPTALETGRRLRLGVLPLGTGNSLVEHVRSHAGGGRRRSAGQREEALALTLEGLQRGVVRPVDVLELRGGGTRTFALSTATLGLPTEVAETVNAHLKPLRGAAYHVGALWEALRLRTVPFRATLESDGGETTLDLDSPLIALQNTSTFGLGMHIAPDARLDDGLGDLVVVRPVSRIDLLRTLPRVYDGSHVDHPAVSIHRFRRLVLAPAPPRKLMIDGEIRSMKLDTVEVLPLALDLRF